jgi:hypothetical protein
VFYGTCRSIGIGLHGIFQCALEGSVFHVHCGAEVPGMVPTNEEAQWIFRFVHKKICRLGVDIYILALDERNDCWWWWCVWLSPTAHNNHLVVGVFGLVAGADSGRQHVLPPAGKQRVFIVSSVMRRRSNPSVPNQKKGDVPLISRRFVCVCVCVCVCVLEAPHWPMLSARNKSSQQTLDQQCRDSFFRREGMGTPFSLGENSIGPDGGPSRILSFVTRFVIRNPRECTVDSHSVHPPLAASRVSNTGGLHP